MATTKPAPPCTLVIFGARGDLTKRLLMPAIYNLAGAKLLDAKLQIKGLDHNDCTTDTWRTELNDALQSFTKDAGAEFHPASIDQATWGWVARRLEYTVFDFEKADDYAKLKDRLSGDVIFYCAVAPRFFGTIAEQLGKAGLLAQPDGAFRRLAIEKPFGSDLASARALNERLLTVAGEQQIYRIDHFLGKEPVQGILPLRFDNGLFEPMWTREHVAAVQITAAETLGVEERGKFYEATGALRDMVPNHLFSLLTMTAMERPASYAPEDVRDAKVELLRAIRPIAPDDAVAGSTRRAPSGKPVKAYTAEDESPPTRAPKRTRRCACSSTTRAGRASRSTCAPASGSHVTSPRSCCSCARAETCSRWALRRMRVSPRASTRRSPVRCCRPAPSKRASPTRISSPNRPPSATRRCSTT